MRQYLLLILLSISTISLSAQSVFEDFESFDLPDESFLNGSANPGGFTTNFMSFSNVYDPGYNFWYGWAISNVTDSITAGFMNQYGAITGGGVNESKHFAVSYDILGENKIILDPAIQGKGKMTMYITNATYPYLSMKDGDGFAKKFGGEDGNDPDFFLLTIRSYRDGQLSVESVDVYLADYRFDDNSQDYILDDWTFVDLSSLGDVDSLSFVLSSSDNGAYGMNTPAYFCVDDISVNIPLSTDETIGTPISFYPNPTSNSIFIEDLPVGQKKVQIFNTTGQLMKSIETPDKALEIDLHNLVDGTYYTNIIYSQGIKQFSFFKSE